MRILPLLATLLAAAHAQGDTLPAPSTATSTATAGATATPTPSATSTASPDTHTIVAYTPSSGPSDPAAAVAADPTLLTVAPAHTRFGLMFDVGIPDGSVLSVVYRPWKFLRVHGGGSYDVLGYGLRAGASLVPFYFAVTPSLNFEIGHYFDSDITSVAHKLANVSTDFDPILRHFGFNYASAQLGLEMGSPRRFVFFLRAGLSKVWTTVSGVQQLTGSDAPAEVSDPTLRAVIPSAKFGFIAYVY